VKDSIRGYMNRQYKCLAGFNCPDIPFGIGVKITDEGRLQIIGDGYKSTVFDEVKQAIEDRYKAIVFAQALQRLGYSVKTVENKKMQEIVIEAVRA